MNFIKNSFFFIFLSLTHPCVEASETAYLELFKFSLQSNPKLLDTLSFKAFDHLVRKVNDPDSLNFNNQHPLLKELKKQNIIIGTYIICDVTKHVKNDIPFMDPQKKYFLLLPASEYKKWIILFKKHQQKKKIQWKNWTFVSSKEHATPQKMISAVLKPGMGMLVTKPIVLLSTAV